MEKTILTQANMSRYRKQCLGKKYYANEKLANRAAYQTSRLKNGPQKPGVIQPYQCDFCLMWHVGHTIHIRLTPEQQIWTANAGRN